MTIDVERLIRETTALHAELEARGPDHLPAFPPLRLPRVHRLIEPA
jgi:hypothetical protein